MANRKGSCLVGVVGGSASGKGTVVSRLLGHYGDRAAVLRMDDYYRPLGEVPTDGEGEPNFDVPGALDLERLSRDLDVLSSGQDLRIQSYTFNQPGVLPETLLIPACPVVFLDGLFLLCDEGVRNRLDLTVLIHATPETRFERRFGQGPSGTECASRHHPIPVGPPCQARGLEIPRSRGPSCQCCGQ